MVYNRTTTRTQEFMADRAVGTGITGAETLADFVASLAAPRQIVIMV